VVLGDTSDPWAIKDHAMDATLLVHEATNAYIPSGIDPQSPKSDTEESVKQRAIQRGHSTPAMAGEFARAIRARGLVLNHFGSRSVALIISSGLGPFSLESCLQMRVVMLESSK
jgi:ribonuclease Z